MVTVDPTTNTPLDNWPSSATDELGRSSRKVTSLYAMAVEGFSINLPPKGASFRMSYSLAIEVQDGQRVLQRVETCGPDGVRSIKEARELRMFLAFRAGRFDGILEDELHRLGGIPVKEVAEIRVGIRHRNGSLRQEWI